MSSHYTNVPVEGEESAIYPGNEVVILTQEEQCIPSSMGQTQGYTENITENKPYSEHLLEVIVNQNKELIEENKKLREVNNKIYEHFAEEFVGLKRSIDQTLAAFKRQRTLCSKLPSLPFNDVNEILDFEKILQNDEEMRQELITKFARQPTDDLKKFIVANLKYIFNDDYLARNFSWTNVNNNISVKDFICIKLLKESAMENIPQTNYTKIDETLKQFFNSAKDRFAKLSKRTSTQLEGDKSQKM
ncbi:uncharacterized protein [Eurosta solidaginis]|uniref:uncharacterized protein n=1 Tax=Eurosta solidaginis TaxID=178769 RepID=UPI00353058DF